MKLGLFGVLILVGLGACGGYYGHDSIKGVSSSAQNTVDNLRK